MFEFAASRGRADAASPSAVAVRVDGGSAVVCGVCGCLLDADGAVAGEGAYFHFRGARGQDARGCSVACLTSPHRIVLVGPALPRMAIATAR